MSVRDWHPKAACAHAGADRHPQPKGRSMGATDVLLTSVSTQNPTNSDTTGADPTSQTRVSDFLTVQSLTNFATMVGAITLAWKALTEVSSRIFGSQWTPLALALGWLVVSLVVSAQAQGSARIQGRFWVSAIFIGILNTLVLFAAAIGVS